MQLACWITFATACIHTDILSGKKIKFSIFTRDSIYAIARICYRPYVRHTGGSYKNGWRQDYEIFTIR